MRGARALSLIREGRQSVGVNDSYLVDLVVGIKGNF